MSGFRKCKQLNCGARPMQNDPYCYFHSQTTEEARKEASAKGGKANLKTDSDFQERLELKTEDEVRNLLISTINDLRQNKISSKTASVIGYLALQALPLIKENEESEIHKAWFKKHPDAMFYEPLSY